MDDIDELEEWLPDVDTLTEPVKDGFIVADSLPTALGLGAALAEGLRLVVTEVLGHWDADVVDDVERLAITVPDRGETLGDTDVLPVTD